MYSVIKHQVTRPLALPISQLARASSSSHQGKVQPHSFMGEDEYFVNASYYDDFASSSSMKPGSKNAGQGQGQGAATGMQGDAAQAQTQQGEAALRKMREKKKLELESERDPTFDDM
ncbi:hypothetical protein PHISP_02930 [Aspergillus sp. HF37]|nr:hypothetical protein PHISP_02930 [Aspergillus sp. HF37]